MTVDEIFTKLSSHMVEGVMLHEQMADYYDFLNLHGYKRCHEYHMHCEMKYMRKLHRYYINRYNRLIEEEPLTNPNIIPASWYRYTRQEVDANTKRQAVRNGIEKWVSWEKDTKELYEKMYKELMELGEVSSAEKLSCFIYEVDRELKKANRKHISLLTVDYSISYIMGEQDRLHEHYKEKME